MEQNNEMTRDNQAVAQTAKTSAPKRRRPGLIKDGVVKDFALWGKLRNIPLAEFLCERTSFKTKVDNNCNTWLFGEMWNGYAQDCSDALFILNSEGVGCGIAQAAGAKEADRTQ